MSFTRVSRTQFQMGAFLRILTPGGTLVTKKGFQFQTSYFLLRILTPRREPGHKNGL